MEEWDLLLGESLAGYGEKYPDVRVRRRLVQETPAQALVGRSETASTVVVGSRGRSGLTARVLGSVSRTVAEHGRCTVVVVRGDLS